MFVHKWGKYQDNDMYRLLNSKDFFKCNLELWELKLTGCKLYPGFFVWIEDDIEVMIPWLLLDNFSMESFLKNKRKSEV